MRKAEAVAKEAAAKKKAEEAKTELEKARPKMPAYVRGQMVKSNVAIVASKYACNKLRACKFCEIWYFTPEGIAEARRASTALTSMADTDGGVDISNSIVIKTGSNQPSKKVVADASLDMSQLLPGMVLWIEGMVSEKILRCGWSARSSSKTIHVGGTPTLGTLLSSDIWTRSAKNGMTG